MRGKLKFQNQKIGKKKKIVRGIEKVEAMGDEGLALIPIVMYISWICVYFGIFVWK
jgi:hypothetical protein